MESGESHVEPSSGSFVWRPRRTPTVALVVPSARHQPQDRQQVVGPVSPGRGGGPQRSQSAAPAFARADSGRDRGASAGRSSGSSGLGRPQDRGVSVPTSNGGKNLARDRGRRGAGSGAEHDHGDPASAWPDRPDRQGEASGSALTSSLERGKRRTSCSRWIFKGWFALVPAGAQCHPLTILDDHSRFALALEACGNERGETVQQARRQEVRHQVG